MSDRRTWTATDLADIKRQLLTTSTEEIAKRYSLPAKAIRATLRRYGISILAVRKEDRPKKFCEGIAVRRSAFPPAIYGAEALVALPDRCCHWPIGDPAKPDFSFCAAPVDGFGRPYCPAHRARARGFLQHKPLS